MKDPKNILILALSLGLLIIGGFFYIQISELKKTNQMLLRNMNLGQSSGKNSKAKDPYKQIVIPNTLRKQAPNAQKCYNTFLKTKPKTTAGQIELDWQIDASGKPSKPEVVHTTLNAKSLQNCIINIVAKVHFPAPPYGQPVYYVYKYNFKDTK